jgi:hypothetical protein
VTFFSKKTWSVQLNIHFSFLQNIAPKKKTHHNIHPSGKGEKTVGAPPHQLIEA